MVKTIILKGYLVKPTISKTLLLPIFTLALIVSAFFYSNLFFSDSKFYYCGQHSVEAVENESNLEACNRIFESRYKIKGEDWGPYSQLDEVLAQVIYFTQANPLKLLDPVTLSGFADLIASFIIFSPFNAQHMSSPLFFSLLVIGLTFVALPKKINLIVVAVFINPYFLLILTNFSQDGPLILATTGLVFVAGHLCTNTVRKFNLAAISVLCVVLFLFRLPALIFLIPFLISGYSVIHPVWQKHERVITTSMAITSCSLLYFAASQMEQSFVYGGRDFFVNYKSSGFPNNIWDYAALISGLANDGVLTNKLLLVSFTLPTVLIIASLFRKNPFILIAFIATDVLFFLISPSPGAFFRYRIVLTVAASLMICDHNKLKPT